MMQETIAFRSRTARAFSLLELLIALAITALLAAVFFPVFARARSGRDTGCLSNWQRAAQAFTLYSQDYDGIRGTGRGQFLSYVSRSIAPCPNGAYVGSPNFTHVRGYAHGSRRSPNMTWHNGTILPVVETAAIFWGTS